MKKIILTTILFSLFSCAVSETKKEAAKSAKAGAASSRINYSDSNSLNIFKELDE